jgi:hypothetical protein
MATAVDVKKFLEEGSSKPLGISEFNAFWRELTPEEKAEYTSGVDALKK